MKRPLQVALTVCACAATVLVAQSRFPTTAGKAHKFEAVADGVYYATSSGSMATGSNNVAVVGDRDVLVAHSSTT